MTEQELAERIAKSEARGRAAFRAGVNCSAQDVGFMPLIRGCKVGEGTALPILEAWNKGWHAENLNAPVE